MKSYIRHTATPTTGAILTTLIFCSLSAIAAAQTPKDTTKKASEAARAAAASSIDPKLQFAAIEKAIETKRSALHIPGAALVIVKDDKVIYTKTFGLRDVERKLPVTPNTLFAIGSSTKAFAAMTVMMSVDDKKLALSDSPKKYLPYFKLRDPDADAKITISDLLCHRSGLDRTDLPFYSNKLTSEEIIRVASLAKPTAKLGEKFQYQNVMFIAAGEIVSDVQGKPWTEVVAERIFAPLGMTASNTSVPKTLLASDHSLGYIYDANKKKLKLLPMHDIFCAAPAGAINSNVKDMAQWLRLMLNNGVFNGKRLVSESSFTELSKKHMTVGGGMDYGYGWFLHDWHGHKIVEHGGNIDGFNAEVALMPDLKLGFVLLTNVSASPLAGDAQGIVWENIVGDPTALGGANKIPAGDVKREVGAYTLEEADLTITIALEKGVLKATVPGQPVYPLKNVGGRRWQLGSPAPDGFFVTFRLAKDNLKQAEMFLEQPQGNAVLTKEAVIDPEDELKAAYKGAQQTAKYTGPLKDLLHYYENKVQNKGYEITVRDRKVVLLGPYKVSERAKVDTLIFQDNKIALVVPHKTPHAVVQKAGMPKDTYGLEGLPEGTLFVVRRDAAHKVIGLTLTIASTNTIELKMIPKFVPPFSGKELVQKMITAMGGEAAIKKHHSMVSRFTMLLDTLGMTAQGTIYARSPKQQTTETIFYALGKPIFTQREYFDGKAGGDENSFAASEPKSGFDLRTIAAESDFYGDVNWKQRYDELKIARVEEVVGEEAYVLEKTLKNAWIVSDYISTKSFLLLRHDVYSGGVPVTEILSDYRPVDGWMIPFKHVQTVSNLGEVIMTITDVQFDIALPESTFKPAVTTKTTPAQK